MSEFLCRELGHFDAESKRAHAAIGKLVSGGLLRPFDELAAQVGHPAEDHFAVPLPHYHFHFNSFPELVAQAGGVARAWGISAGDWLFPSDGWTQAVWRDGMLMLTDDWRDAGIARLWRQIAKGRGPISALAAAEMFRAAGSNSFAEYSAGRGLRRLSPEEFRDDCGELLGGRGFVSQCLLQAAAAARQLNSADIQAIADLLERLEVLDASQANIFARCACAFLGGERDTPAQNAADALDALWTVGLSQWVERRLHALATPPALAEPEPFAAPTYPVTTAGPPFAPAEPEKPIEKEVRELKWLASALTDRLKSLEERLATGVQNNANAETTMTNETQVSIEPGVNGLSFHLHGPDGLIIVLGSERTSGPLPTGVLVDCGAVSGFFLTGLKGHENERIDVEIRTAWSLPEGLSDILDDGVRLEFTEADLNAALTGNTVTIVVLCAEDAAGARTIKTLSSAEGRPALAVNCRKTPHAQWALYLTRSRMRRLRMLWEDGPGLRKIGCCGETCLILDLFRHDRGLPPSSAD
ncbi:MAG TPA: hypothetical protein VF278_01480 [Pirellulales bacterium]